MLISPNRRHSDSGELPDHVRVLLVDDDDHFRAWMSRLMKRLGFAVATAADGVEALDVLRGSWFDLVISDFEMPRMNGLELIREIRAHPQLANQYSVMLTSHEDVESKVTALTAGYDDFLPKSCTEVEVAAKVIAAKRMLSRHRVLSAAAQEWQTIATRDELTGVATRRTLLEEAERCIADGRPIGFALIDLDDFKPINDTFGHLTGDRILRDVGALFLRRTRGSDLIGRFGGDEFVLLVRDLPIEDLAGATERLAAEIEALRWTSGDTTISIRVTSGVAHTGLLSGATVEQLLDVADRDLYAKKWVKKHPGARPELYEYAGPRTGGAIVPLQGGDNETLRVSTREEK